MSELESIIRQIVREEISQHIEAGQQKKRLRSFHELTDMNKAIVLFYWMHVEKKNYIKDGASVIRYHFPLLSRHNLKVQRSRLKEEGLLEVNPNSIPGARGGWRVSAQLREELNSIEEQNPWFLQSEINRLKSEQSAEERNRSCKIKLEGVLRR